MLLPKIIRYCLCLLMINCLGLITEVNAESSKKNILVLHSYAKGLSWTDSVTNGIEDAVNKGLAGGLNIHVNYEFMDTKRFSQEGYYQLLFAIYKYKYVSNRPDVIITADDNALNFMLQYRDVLFKDIPIVFTGVNFFADSMLRGHKKITGVVEAFNLRANVQLILDLHPDTKEIVIISDQTTTGKSDVKALNKISPEFESAGVRFRFINAGVISEYQAAVKQLHSGSVIIAMHMNKDKSGRTFTFEEGFNIYAKYASVPIYSPWDFFLGSGAVGGYVISGKSQGYEAGRMAVRLLTGATIESIPILSTSPNRYVFDYKQLLRFGIDESRLPRSAEIINKQSILIDFYNEYKVIIWLVIGFVISLVITIVLLIINILRRIRAEQERILTYQQLVATNQAYSRFVPHNFLDFLGRETIMDVKLGDQVQEELTVLFSDIRSFTSISENMTPVETFKFINDYLSQVGPIVRENDGFIDKYIGDAVMALFPKRPRDAIKAAIEMQHKIAVLNDQRQQQAKVFRDNPPFICAGIGIHTGSLMLGMIGEAQRMEGTVISDAVNLASRIEGLTKVFGAGIAVSVTSLRHCQGANLLENYNYRFLGTVKVKGKNATIKIFEVFDGDNPELIALKKRTLDSYNLALDHYFDRHFAEAKRLFDQIVEINVDDQSAKFYSKRCLQLESEVLREDWDGVITFDSK